MQTNNKMFAKFIKKNGMKINFSDSNFFQIKRCTKEEMFSMCSVPFVERTHTDTLGNTNLFSQMHMHILIINNCNGNHTILTKSWLPFTYKLKYIHNPN